VRVGIVTAVLVFSALITAKAAAECLPLDDSVVNLTGQIVTRTYPGPPNYEDIRRGDRPETQLVLILPRPICAVGCGITGTIEKPLRIDDVTEITLVPSDTVPRIQAIGKVFTVSGTLFEAHTAHHRTKLLLTLRSVNLSSNPRLKIDVENARLGVSLFRHGLAA